MPIVRPLALALLLLQFPPPSVDLRPRPDTPARLAPYRTAASQLIGGSLASDFAW
ncbi:MAG: hypothetical protein ACRD1V_06400 [Vicinamibacterales bacterium]